MSAGREMRFLVITQESLAVGRLSFHSCRRCVVSLLALDAHLKCWWGGATVRSQSLHLLIRQNGILVGLEPTTSRFHHFWVRRVLYQLSYSPPISTPSLPTILLVRTYCNRLLGYLWTTFRVLLSYSFLLFTYLNTLRTIWSYVGRTKRAYP